MSSFFLLIGAALVAYLCRLSGFMFPIRDTSASWERFLQLVPIAVFTTLTVSSLSTHSDEISGKLIALVLAGLAMTRTRNFGTAVVVGLATYWIVTTISGG